MKLSITIFILATTIFLSSCKKERTCSCDVNTKSTIITTPRNSGTPSTSNTNSTGHTDFTKSSIKKSDFSTLYDCNDRTETTASTYTTMVTVTTVSTISGYTFQSVTSHPADVSQVNTTEYTCEIK